LICVGKGNEERLFPFSAALRRFLFRYMQANKSSRFLFASRNGSRLSYDNTRRDIAKICAAAGVGTKVHPHLFRHSFAASYIRQGRDIYRLAHLGPYAGDDHAALPPVAWCGGLAQRPGAAHASREPD
jgi:site-specific recombinase XerD